MLSIKNVMSLPSAEQMLVCNYGNHRIQSLLQKKTMHHHYNIFF
jgi:hypothetical protein